MLSRAAQTFRRPLLSVLLSFLWHLGRDNLFRKAPALLIFRNRKQDLLPAPQGFKAL